jgi:hypothetical protein
MEWCWSNKIKICRETPVPVSHCPPQIQHEHGWHWTQVLRGKRPATNRLSHDVALQNHSSASIAGRNCFKLNNWTTISVSKTVSMGSVTCNNDFIYKYFTRIISKVSSAIRGIQEQKTVLNQPYIDWDFKTVVTLATRKLDKENLRD